MEKPDKNRDSCCHVGKFGGYIHEADFESLCTGDMARAMVVAGMCC